MEWRPSQVSKSVCHREREFRIASPLAAKSSRVASEGCCQASDLGVRVSETLACQLPIDVIAQIDSTYRQLSDEQDIIKSSNTSLGCQSVVVGSSHILFMSELQPSSQRKLVSEKMRERHISKTRTVRKKDRPFPLR